MRIKGFDVLKEALGMAGLLRDPHAIQNIYRIEDGMVDAGVTRRMVDHVLQDPDMRRIVQDRYLRGQVPNLEPLRDLPDGSLGREYVRHIEDFGFNPAYYQPLEVRDDLTYILARVRETHDIWHVVLGFRPTPIGEIGLKSFELTQLHRPMAGVIVAGGILRHLAIGFEQFSDVLAAIAGGYELGKEARPLLAERWEEHWNEQVDSIRQRLQVGRISDAALGSFDPRGVKPSRVDEKGRASATAEFGQASLGR